jgi:hypothetical protein
MKENPMKLFAQDNTEITRNSFRSIRAMLFTQGFGVTLEYFCTFSVFSVLSEA